MPGLTERLYDRLSADADQEWDDGVPDETRQAAPANAARLVGSLTLLKAGDRIIDPKTTLTWLLASVGSPAWMVALLVPIRESGSLLPQAFVAPWVQRFRRRKRVWVIGAVGQATAIAAIALCGATLSGVVAGVGILAALAVFALMRSLSSISVKDVLGKTLPEGRRGSVSGVAAGVAGVSAIAAGIGLGFIGSDTDASGLALVVGVGALAWAGAAWVFSRVREHAAEPGEDGASGIGDAVALLRDDHTFRRFVVARSLLLVTALSPPFIIVLGSGSGAVTTAGLGPYVGATGVAFLVGSPLWGRVADHSSRLVMTVAAGGGAAVIIVFLAMRQATGDRTWLAVGAYLLVSLAHAGARVGRSTYVVDLASGDLRTRYVAVSNTVIGAVLLATGLLGVVVGLVGPAWVLAILASAGVAGVATVRTLPDVEGG